MINIANNYRIKVTWISAQQKNGPWGLLSAFTCTCKGLFDGVTIQRQRTECHNRLKRYEIIEHVVFIQMRRNVTSAFHSFSCRGLSIWCVQVLSEMLQLQRIECKTARFLLWSMVKSNKDIQSWATSPLFNWKHVALYVLYTTKCLISLLNVFDICTSKII